MAKARGKHTIECPVETTLKIIGGKWKELILYFLIDEKRRFGELNRLLGGLASRTLSKQLRELEADGIVHRKDFGEIPPRVEYSITPLGKSLKPILLAMEAWGTQVEKNQLRKKSTR